MNRATVLEEIRDGVLLLTLNRPQRRNAFNDQQYDDLRSALADAQADERVHVVVIAGGSGAFSAGQDLDEISSVRGFTPFVDQLSVFDKPLMAAVTGVAVGIGLTLLPHCDIVYVGETARLRAPFTALGLVCEAGSSLLLPMIVGPQRAAELLFTARWIDAEQAVDLHLAARVYPDQELLPAALATARDIAAQPPAAVQQIKRLLLATRLEALKAARVREDAAQAQRLGSPENVAAIRAFQQKGKPSPPRR